MTKSEIFERIKEIFRAGRYYYLPLQVEEISEDTSVISDLSMDSIQFLEFMVDVEEVFKITLDFERLDINSIEKISGVVSLIEENLSDA
jgi:acyl carrier protein